MPSVSPAITEPPAGCCTLPIACWRPISSPDGSTAKMHAPHIGRPQLGLSRPGVPETDWVVRPATTAPAARRNVDYAQWTSSHFGHFGWLAIAIQSADWPFPVLAQNCEPSGRRGYAGGPICSGERVKWGIMNATGRTSCSSRRARTPAHTARPVRQNDYAAGGATKNRWGQKCF